MASTLQMINGSELIQVSVNVSALLQTIEGILTKVNDQETFLSLLKRKEESNQISGTKEELEELKQEIQGLQSENILYKERVHDLERRVEEMSTDSKVRAERHHEEIKEMYTKIRIERENMNTIVQQTKQEVEATIETQTTDFDVKLRTTQRELEVAISREVRSHIGTASAELKHGIEAVRDMVRSTSKKIGNLEEDIEQVRDDLPLISKEISAELDDIRQEMSIQHREIKRENDSNLSKIRKMYDIMQLDVEALNEERTVKSHRLSPETLFLTQDVRSHPAAKVEKPVNDHLNSPLSPKNNPVNMNRLTKEKNGETVVQNIDIKTYLTSQSISTTSQDDTLPGTKVLDFIAPLEKTNLRAGEPRPVTKETILSPLIEKRNEDQETEIKTNPSLEHQGVSKHIVIEEPSRESTEPRHLSHGSLIELTPNTNQHPLATNNTVKMMLNTPTFVELKRQIDGQIMQLRVDQDVFQNRIESEFQKSARDNKELFHKFATKNDLSKVFQYESSINDMKDLIRKHERNLDHIYSNYWSKEQVWDALRLKADEKNLDLKADRKFVNGLFDYLNEKINAMTGDTESSDKLLDAIQTLESQLHQKANLSDLIEIEKSQYQTIGYGQGTNIVSEPPLLLNRSDIFNDVAESKSYKCLSCNRPLSPRQRSPPKDLTHRSPRKSSRLELSSNNERQQEALINSWTGNEDEEINSIQKSQILKLNLSKLHEKENTIAPTPPKSAPSSGRMKRSASSGDYTRRNNSDSETLRGPSDSSYRVSSNSVSKLARRRQIPSFDDNPSRFPPL